STPVFNTSSNPFRRKEAVSAPSAADLQAFTSKWGTSSVELRTASTSAPSLMETGAKRKASDVGREEESKKIKLQSSSKPASVNTFQKTFNQIQQKSQANAKLQSAVVDKLEKWLNLLSSECIMCFWMKSQCKQKRHEFKKCQFMQSDLGPAYMEWKNRIQYNTRYHPKICYICHVPSFGDRLHSPFRSGPSSCNYLDIILPTLYFAFHNDKGPLESKFGMTWSTLDQFTQWLIARPVREKEKSNLVSFFLEYMELTHEEIV
ncbi:hypothetical protein BDZ97DRAFT_1772128, partial [Flammula alnicola]